MSIRTKLTLYAMAAAGVGVTVAVGLIVLSLSQRRDAVPDLLEERADRIVVLLRQAQPNRAEIRALLAVVAADPALRRAAVYDPARGRAIVEPPFSDGHPDPGPLVTLGYNDDALRWASALPSEGRVVLWYDGAQLYGSIQQTILLVAIALFGAMATAVIFARLASRWIAQPIVELATLARSIPESGDFPVAAVSVGRDEVGQLGAAFSEMLAKVERRERALDDARAAAERAASEAEQMAAQAQASAEALSAEIAARERTQRQLEQAQKMEALGRLAGGVAHDFNNLLFVIGTYTDELGKRLDGEDQESIEQVREAVRRAIKLTQQLLSFSRQPRGEPTEVDVGQMLTRMQSLLRRLIGEDIELTVQGSDQRMVVRAPEGALESAVMNLVVNARDALPTGGAIRISMRRVAAPTEIPHASASGADRWMVLSIEDDGEGMDEGTRLRAFEPFFTTKAAGEGTGLGLTLVYALCRQLGGQVTVDSEPGHGTRFDLLMPLSAGESGFSADLPSMTPLPSEEGRILVAEDDLQVRRLIVRVLTRAGFEVEAVEDGQVALTRLEEGPPVDLVVSDVVMPKMGGLDLAQALRRAQIEVPILFISGYPAHPGQSTAPFPPELPMLRKPFTAQALRRIVRRMLGRNPITPPPFEATPTPFTPVVPPGGEASSPESAVGETEPEVDSDRPGSAPAGPARGTDDRSG